MLLCLVSQIVVFSPARRASRKLLERMVEVRRSHLVCIHPCYNADNAFVYSQFIRLLGHEYVTLPTPNPSCNFHACI